jgi:hypothetical protein
MNSHYTHDTQTAQWHEITAIIFGTDRHDTGKSMSDAGVEIH